MNCEHVETVSANQAAHNALVSLKNGTFFEGIVKSLPFTADKSAMVTINLPDVGERTVLVADVGETYVGAPITIECVPNFMKPGCYKFVMAGRRIRALNSPKVVRALTEKVQ
jgi:hypothetical protein